MKNIDIHMVNVVGLGAKEFVKGLLNQIKCEKNISFHTIYRHSSSNEGNNVPSYKVVSKNYRFGVISRLIEICFWFLICRSKNDLLVLGDLPLNTKAKQYVLCHQALIFYDFSIFEFQYWKFLIFRNLFKVFLKKQDVVLVQSLQMKHKVSKLIKHKSRVEIILIDTNSGMWPKFRRTGRHIASDPVNKIRMIYPAANYEHKNHSFVSHIAESENVKIIFTTDPGEVNFESPNVTCLGKLSRSDLFEIYRDTDALLFLSSCESLGLPLLEAIKCNIPILCPYRDYSQTFSTKNCIFFDLDDPRSLQTAINKLRQQLTTGWWPNWSFRETFEIHEALTLRNILLDK
jgi:glycosyltransferase involved in cell wall biosynthesis